jgi:tellurite methyltransferase
MPLQDAIRWNTRYRDEARYNTFESARPLLVQQACHLPASGLALDAAMGLGGNAGFLMQHGLRVLGVDVSWVAVRKAKERLPDLMAVLADLTEFKLSTACFDVIVNFFYLQRDLWSSFKRALRPGGVLLMESMIQEMAQVKPEIDPAYLLQPDELRESFSDFEFLFYYEGWQNSDGKHPRAVASLVARKLQTK